ncbi:hypothetical protein B0H65DRAFT_290953 [Neurospora tetraspora]|uniref:Secreted protein n=1 Tax=Neurospora tetraspora TaxID=94610 RepID=A0AAE0J9I3_9PEZI|nr:hypothetical protein B0H65DRAFT_290953 [Neurospora tetraspora]
MCRRQRQPGLAISIFCSIFTRTSTLWSPAASPSTLPFHDLQIASARVLDYHDLHHQSRTITGVLYRLPLFTLPTKTKAPVLVACPLHFLGRQHPSLLDTCSPPGTSTFARNSSIPILIPS